VADLPQQPGADAAFQALVDALTTAKTMDELRPRLLAALNTLAYDAKAAGWRQACQVLEAELVETMKQVHERTGWPCGEISVGVADFTMRVKSLADDGPAKWFDENGQPIRKPEVRQVEAPHA
jgi:hypothetical protein